MKVIGFLVLIAMLPATSMGQKKKGAPVLEQWKTAAASGIQERYNQYKDIAFAIWEYAELGYKEEKSSALLQQALKENGFKVEAGVAGIPTAFVASFGEGGPVLGILAEFDALPGLSQQAIPEKKPVEGKTTGHGCGHHLFGTASIAAAIQVKELMQQYNWKGTLKVFGTPAEEGGSGKVYMVREGLFNGVDAVLHWHPADENTTWADGALANKSAKFRFYGTAAHAAAAPEKGRSSLDAVEAMNYMINMMREHIPADAKIHYVITQGGKAPNVVPDFAEVYYYVRHPNREVVMDLFERIRKASEGAAMGTETRTDFEIIGGTYDLLLNNALAACMQSNLLRIGGVRYTADELEFAKKIQSSFGFAVDPVETASTIKPIRVNSGKTTGSTDVGDVSYTVPTVGLRAATWVPGTPAHSWQAVACGKTEIGAKGMMVAAKTMALTLLDLLHEPAILPKARAEFDAARGAGFRYIPLLGNRAPALNYRD